MVKVILANYKEKRKLKQQISGPNSKGIPPSWGLKAKKDWSQNDGDDADDNREGHADLDEIGKLVSSGTIDHEVCLIAHGRDKAA